MAVLGAATLALTSGSLSGTSPLAGLLVCLPPALRTPRLQDGAVRSGLF